MQLEGSSEERNLQVHAEPTPDYLKGIHRVLEGDPHFLACIHH
jgi:hypothetical protein